MTPTVTQIKESGGFSIIYADPAWRYQNTGLNGSAEKHYATMSIAELCALPVADIAASNSVLFLWCCNPLLPEALQVMKTWGFTYKTVPFTWVKLTKNGLEHYGTGRWTRANPEQVLLGVRGKIRPVDASLRHLVWDEHEPLDMDPETFIGPLGRHSAKPTQVRERIDALMGDLPRVELFARQRAEGWFAWGAETDSDFSMEVPT